MAYATLADVQGRAGRLSEAWTDASRPSIADVERFLQDTSRTIDGYLAARQFTVPTTGASASALGPLNADMATLLALESTLIASDVKDDLMDRVRERVRVGLDALIEGKHSAVLILEGGAGAPSSSSFWIDEPDYPTDADIEYLAERPHRIPAVTRAMRF